MKGKSNMYSRIRAFALGAMAIGASSAYANSDMSFRFSGFGTVAATTASLNDADYAKATQPNGPGYTSEWSLNRDSLLGLQLDTRLNSRFALVLQGIAFQRYDNSWRPDMTLANITYQPNDEWTLRLGRFAVPFYLVSEFRRVGYATPWLRAPQEFYGVDFTTLDGADVTWSAPTGRWIVTANAFLARSEIKMSHDIVSTARRAHGLNVTAEHGDHKFRASHAAADLTLESPLDPIFDAYRGAGFASIAQKYRPDDTYSSFTSFGYQWSPGDWLVMAEYGIVRTEEKNIFTNYDSAYVTVSYSFGNVRPFLTVARRDAALPGYVNTGMALPDAHLNTAIAQSDNSQTSISVGMRWDFMTNAALKVQYDHIDLDDGSYGGLQNVNKVPMKPGQSFDVLAIGVDFVF